MAEEKIFDVIIAGAGFSGLYTLHKLRKDGFSVTLFEAGGGLGGVWYWNCYPGARVDSDHQVYQFGNDELYKDFKFSERFPGRDEFVRYFQYVDEKLDLSKDIKFNSRVTAAAFNDELNRWLVTTVDGTKTWCRNLILCTGFADKRYTPAFEGLENFQGECHHTSLWPQEGVDLKGKRVSVIGTGATGIQLVHAIGDQVSHLTVYQRTPNLALPMRQYKAADEHKWKLVDDAKMMEMRKETMAGVNFTFNKKNALDCTPEEREAFFESLWQFGGFAYWFANYQDVLQNLEANAYAYEFWCRKTRERLSDPKKQHILAPIEPPHPFGTKRPCLEQGYYEVMNQDNVDIIDIRESPIIRISAKGVETEKEGVVEVDVLILATGFDTITGGILSIDITNGKGESLKDKWKPKTTAYLGMCVAGFPNLLYMYGPLATTGFSNGPTSAQVQGDWISDFLVHLRNSNISRFEPDQEAENKWSQMVQDIYYNSLLPLAKFSWYEGANIPGKRKEALVYTAGIPAYIKELEHTVANKYDKFVLG